MTSTTTTLNSSSSTSVYGSSVTFTATVTPFVAGAAMTGSVTFFNGAVAIGSGSITWNSLMHIGTATVSTATLPGGSRSIKAAYSGDSNYSPSISSAFTQTVNTKTQVVTLNGSNSIVYGQPVTLSVSIPIPTTGTVPATGTITFKDGSTTLGTATLLPGVGVSAPSAQTSLTVISLSVASHGLTASYPGDSNYSSATSSTLSVMVSKASSSTALTSSVNPSALCQSVTFTASVSATSPGSGTPTGTVTFTVNSTPVSTPTLVGGVATYSTSSLAQGSNTIGVSYSGDSNFNTSSIHL